MSKFKTGVVTLLCVFATLVSVTAYAGPGRGGGSHGSGGFHGGGAHHGGGFRGGTAHFGGRQFGGVRAFNARPRGVHSFSSRPSFHRNRSFAINSAPRFNAPRNAARNAIRTATPNARTFQATRNANAVRHAFNSRPISRALRNTRASQNPRTRALVTAGVATAAWHQGWRDGRNTWWRHRNGGFGWVGPVFWPFAFYDIYDYALWGYGYDDSFWGYGYPDIYAGIFGLYGYDDLIGYAGYLPQYAGRSGNARDAYAYARPPSEQTNLAQMCGEDSRAIGGLPIDIFQRAIQPDNAQRAAIDELASASEQAARSLKASCPTDIALTAPRRLAVMQQRLEAMIAAVQTVQPPLEKFYGLLNDEQKAQLNALASMERRPARRRGHAATMTTGLPGPSCAAQPGLTEWPSAAIDQSVRPTDEQRRHLDALQNAAAKAADMLKTSCQPEEALTPPARLAATGQRLDVMLQAVKTVRVAMDDFYGSLTDEQKADLDAIGPQWIEADQPSGRRRHTHRHRSTSAEHMIRRLLSFVR